MKAQANPENRRVRLTRRLLRESLVELLREKPPERITIKELCEKADLNRSTFYAYYYDVQDLYLEMGNELVDALEAYVQDMRDKHTTGVEPMLTYIRDHGEMFRLLIYNSGALDSTQALQQRILAGTMDLLRPVAEAVGGARGEYLVYFMFYGGDGIIRQWVQRDFDLSPGELSQLLDQAMEATAAPFFSIAGEN